MLEHKISWKVLKIFTQECLNDDFGLTLTFLWQGQMLSGLLHGPPMFAVKVKIYGVLYKQSGSIAFDETPSYWSALKSS